MRRLTGLDAIRGLAAVSVMVHHLGPFDVFDRRIGLDAAVIVFFVLSGYLLYRPFLDREISLRRYAIRRVARIVPAYWVALTGCALLLGTVPAAGEYLFLQVATLPVAWTLQLEVAFYIALPLLARILDGSSRRVIAMMLASLAGTILLLAALRFARLTPDADLLRTFPSMLWAFGAGMLVAIADRSGRLGALASRRWVVAGFAIVLAGFMTNALNMFDVVTAGGAAVLIASVVAGNRPPASAVGLATAAGAISYSLYLWHWPLIWTFGPGGALIAVCVAAIVYVAVERPSIRWAHRRGRVPAPQPSPGPSIA